MPTIELPSADDVRARLVELDDERKRLHGLLRLLEGKTFRTPSRTLLDDEPVDEGFVVTENDEVLLDCEAEGREAFAQGKGMEACQHPKGTPQWSAWRKGNFAARGAKS